MAHNVYTAKVYKAVGFTKGYNFWLWLFLSLGLGGFALVRLQYLDLYGTFCGSASGGEDDATPGECFYYLQSGGRYQLGIMIHLASILPASLLALTQFVPVFRRRALKLHRINGYVAIALSVVGSISALVIARRSMGGGIDTQSMVGLLAIIFSWSLYKGVVCARHHQIEKHRVWMLRAWVYVRTSPSLSPPPSVSETRIGAPSILNPESAADIIQAGAIVTMRVIIIISAIVLSLVGGYYYATPCDKINYLLKGENATIARYPECASFFSGEDPDRHVVVRASVLTDDRVEIGAVINLVFGTSGWMAMAIHAIGLELYVSSSRITKLPRVDVPPYILISSDMSCV